MEKHEFSRPISLVLNGTNYVQWSQAMTSFLKSRKSWRIVTGEVVKPTKKTDETDDKFNDRLDDWESKNGDIITWVRNTSISRIGQQIGRFTTGKEVWDFLKSRYTPKDLSHQYQLLTALHSKTQQPEQSIDDYLSDLQAIWDQLAQSEPTFCEHDTEKFETYRDNQRVITLLMGLHDKFEPVRAALLHRNPLPSLDDVITELLSEETRFATRAHNSHAVLAVQSSKPTKNLSSRECAYCHATTHMLLKCPIRTCFFCKKVGPGHFQADCYKNPSRRSSSRSSSSTITAATTDSSEADISTAPVTLADITALLKQVTSSSGSAMATTTGSSDETNYWDRP
ncbi:hypothetical protein LguiB_005415 [Lonicera macranthoides]